jgi:hypothetical protein
MATAGDEVYAYAYLLYYYSTDYYMYIIQDTTFGMLMNADE